MKKILSLLLCFIILFSFAVVPCYASDDNGFYFSSMTHQLYVPVFEDGKTIYEPSNNFTVKYGTFDSTHCANLTIPANNTLSYISSFHIDNIKNGHEYNLSFSATSSTAPTTYHGILISIVYYNDTEILKEQTLYTCSFKKSSSSQLTDFDFKFVADASGLSGYDSRIEFKFITYDSSAVTFYITNQIEFIDLDDNTGWFQKIINAIKELPSNFVNGIKAFFDNLGNKLTEVKDSISTFFNSLFTKISELSDNISGFFTSLGDRIQVFFINLGNTIIDGLKALFIPSDNYFSNKFNELQTFFESKFGLFALPFTIIISFLELYSNIGNGSGELVLVPFDIFGYKLWESDVINLKESILGFSDLFYHQYRFDLYEFYLSFVDILIIIGFSRLVKRKYNSMFDTGYFDPPETIYKGDTK